MPEMHFRVRWPDGADMVCYSPSLVIADHLDEGATYEVADFVARATAALAIASERVAAKYGTPCARARTQSDAIRRRAGAFGADDPGRVTVVAFERDRS